MCDPLIGIPDGGFGQVDTILSSYMAMLQTTAGDSWQTLPYRLAEAEPRWANLGWIIFVVPSMCCVVFLFQAITALGARKYYETRVEQKAGRTQFLNVMGNAQTHEHHEHHTYNEDEEEEGEDSWSQSSESFQPAAEIDPFEIEKIAPDANSPNSSRSQHSPPLHSPSTTSPIPSKPVNAASPAPHAQDSPTHSKSPTNTNTHIITNDKSATSPVKSLKSPSAKSPMKSLKSPSARSAKSPMKSGRGSPMRMMGSPESRWSSVSR